MVLLQNGPKRIIKLVYLNSHNTLPVVVIAQILLFYLKKIIMLFVSLDIVIKWEYLSDSRKEGDKHEANDSYS